MQNATALSATVQSSVLQSPPPHLAQQHGAWRWTREPVEWRLRSVGPWRCGEWGRHGAGHGTITVSFFGGARSNERRGQCDQHKRLKPKPSQCSTECTSPSATCGSPTGGGCSSRRRRCRSPRPSSSTWPSTSDLLLELRPTNLRASLWQFFRE